MAKTVFDVLSDKIVEHHNQAKEFLAGGRPKDYAEYRDVCGAIRGLSIALREIQDLAKNFEEEEDND